MGRKGKSGNQASTPSSTGSDKSATTTPAVVEPAGRTAHHTSHCEYYKHVTDAVQMRRWRWRAMFR